MIAGTSYPVTKHPLGFLHTEYDLEQVKSDLVCLLMTNPGERVMLPDYGCPLRSLIFEQNDPVVRTRAKKMIADAITKWEPRVLVKNILVDVVTLNPAQDPEETGAILGIQIQFYNPTNINEIEVLNLEIPTN